MEVLIAHPSDCTIKVHILFSTNFKTCIALVSANPATITLYVQTVASLARAETGPGHVLQLAEGKNLQWHLRYPVLQRFNSIILSS